MSLKLTNTIKQAYILAITCGNHFHSPHNVDLVRDGEPLTSQRIRNAPAISEDVAKEVFAEYAASHCCYSKDPAKEMGICDSQSFDTYRYRLETFSESRSCKWRSEPYRGEPVDPSLRAYAPYPWDVQVEVSPMFKEQKKKVKVPHTSSVKKCPYCGGSGETSCGSCSGFGSVTETSGENNTTSRSCSSCGGSGRETCSTCAGKGKLLTFLQLKIKWKSHMFEFVMDHGIGFPVKLFKKVNGQQTFFDEQHMVSPVVGFLENAINEVSLVAVEEHRAQFMTPIPGDVYPSDSGIATWNAIENPKAQFPPTVCIRRQKQAIELLHLTRVEYEWHGKHYSYYVYGNEQKIYTEYYPKKCCCTVI
nr:protein SSUH2 homolog [Anolis sagrei ordinatus]